MIFDTDPRDSDETSGGDTSDYPDVPTNDKGQGVQVPESLTDYTGFLSNDLAQKSDYPDFKTKGGGMQTTI